MIALSPLGRGAGREVEPQVFDMVAAEPGDEADGWPQPRSHGCPLTARPISVRLEVFHSG